MERSAGFFALLATACAVNPTIPPDAATPACGDGVVQEGELCDPCPTSCDDGLACTDDRRTGSVWGVRCVHVEVVVCANDGCCAEGCSAEDDADCSPSCGNGVLEIGETCDSAIELGMGACPEMCDDGVACTGDDRVGAGCTIVCSHPAIVDCTDGDGCCPAGCGAGSDSDCSASCGDGVVQPPELCDTAITTGEGACPADCDDAMACTRDGMVGGACSLECTHTSITACDPDDGCCPAGCGALADDDCDVPCPSGQYEWDGACVDCDIQVPFHYASVQAAIDAAMPGESVCVAAGVYSGDVRMRAHVHLVGVGDASTIEGSVNVGGLSDGDPTPTRLVRLRITSGPGMTDGVLTNDIGASGIANTGRTFALRVEDVTVEVSGGDTQWCGLFEINGGDVEMTVRRLRCASDRGWRVRVNTQSEAITARIAIRESRFSPDPTASSIYDPIELHFYPAFMVTEPATTRVQVDVVNNVLDRAGGLYIVRGLNAVDAASYVTTANNTFVHGTGENAIWDNTSDGGQPLHTVANNLFYGYSTPIRPRTFPVTEVRNLAPALSPFVDAAALDYHLAAGVAAIDFASPAWAPPIDHDGSPRPNDGDGDGSAIADVGAYER